MALSTTSVREEGPVAAPPPTPATSGRATMTDEQRAAQIRALLKERDGCQRAGLADRVAAIEQSLRSLGAEAVAPAKRAARRKS